MDRAGDVPIVRSPACQPCGPHVRALACTHQALDVAIECPVLVVCRRFSPPSPHEVARSTWDPVGIAPTGRSHRHPGCPRPPSICNLSRAPRTARTLIWTGWRSDACSLKARRCGAGKASGTSRTNPRQGGSPRRKGCHSEELVQAMTSFAFWVRSEASSATTTTLALKPHTTETPTR